MTKIIPSSGSVANRVARPRNKSVEVVSSLIIAIRAATAGARTGTLYSSSNSLIANSNDRYFNRPALKKTIPTPMRIPSWRIESGKRPSRSRTDTHQPPRPVLRGMASSKAFMSFSFDCNDQGGSNQHFQGLSRIKAGLGVEGAFSRITNGSACQNRFTEYEF